MFYKLSFLMLQTKIIYVSLCCCLIIFAYSCKFDEPEDDEKKEQIIEPIDQFSFEEEGEALLVIRPGGQTEYIEDIAEVNRSEFRSTSSGLKYRFIERNPGNIRPRVGDIIILHLKYSNENDSIIFDSKLIDSRLKMRVRPPSHPGGSIEEAYLMMHKNDSAIFKIDGENFYKFTQNRVFAPEYINEGEKLTFHVRLKDVLSNEEFISTYSEIYNHHLQKERSLIERFLVTLDEEFAPIRHNSGLIQINIENGTGEKISQGTNVKIHYTAGFIDGGPFDSSYDRNEPFNIKVGFDDIIPGLEEGLLNMRVGDYSLLIIPFRLAYGDEKHGMVPPFSTLTFEIEVLDAN